MKEPWETLLGGLHDSWPAKEFLDGPTPRIRDLLADDRFYALGGGEQALVYAAEAILRINECWLAMDEPNRARIDRALRAALDA